MFDIIKIIDNVIGCAMQDTQEQELIKGLEFSCLLSFIEEPFQKEPVFFIAGLQAFTSTRHLCQEIRCFPHGQDLPVVTGHVEISDELGFASHGRIADDTLMIGIDLIGKIGDGLFDDFLFRRKIFV